VSPKNKYTSRGTLSQTLDLEIFCYGTSTIVIVVNLVTRLSASNTPLAFVCITLLISIISVPTFLLLRNTLYFAVTVSV